MKKLTSLILALSLLLCLPACGRQQEPPAPDLSEMKAICELGVMECYYHNVAKFHDENASGILFWQKDKHFWIEYSGVVRVGIDADRLDAQLKGNVIYISIPMARVLDCRVDEESLSEDSYIIASDSAKITAEDQVQAFKEAQKRMEDAAAEDNNLLSMAQKQAKKLLESYIANISRGSSVDYRIEWIYLDAQGQSRTPVSEELPAADTEPGEEGQ